MFRVLRSPSQSDGTVKSQIKTDLSLDRAVKWLCVYVVGVLGFFLIVMMTFLKARDSIFCEPIGRGIEDNKSYDVTRAEYDQSYCLEHMIDYSGALVRTQAAQQYTDAATASEPARPVIGISGHGKVLYERYFPYVLAIQAVICACPVLLWKLYSLEILTTAVAFVGEGLKAAENKDGNEDDTKQTEKTEDSGMASKSNSYAQLSHFVEVRRQVEYWSSQTSLLKMYITKLLLHEMFLILIVCFYLCFDIFFGLAFKSDFVCYVDKQVLVNCNFPGAGILRIAWVANLVVIDFALLLNTIQLINITWCMRRPTKYFFHNWSAATGEEDDKRTMFLHDGHLISAICRENLSLLPSSSALRAVQDNNSEISGNIPGKIMQSKSLDSLPESESSFCTAPRPSQAGLPGDTRQNLSTNKLISDV